MARRVLVVDDSELNRQLLRKILGNEYEVLEAENGADALAILNRKYKMISVVLLDLLMPVMDGYELLEKLRGNAALAQIPVIVTTSSTEAGAEARALALGANDFVTKPYDPAIILHRIRNTISLRETAATVNALQRDRLTGLYNRESFFERAAVMISGHEPGYYVLACFDIDNFKVINDQYGPEKGDAVLKHIAATIRAAVEAVGGICCRIMADNFAVLYPRSFLDSAELARMRQRASAFEVPTLPMSISTGRYVVTDKKLPVSGMYDRAVIARDRVKGRFDVHIAQYDESMREYILREQEIVNDMKHALESGQFEVWFQPQYNHATGAMVGAEALVRWRHPEKGLIPPGDFIPVFERNGFVYELDKFVWERVCADLRRWIGEGRSPLPVSVNISRYDIFRDDLIETITALVRRYELPVELLRLEITESAFATSTEQIIRVVRALIDYGFTVEIDDFGSGYSSLNTLKDVPSDILKLDMRFLRSDGNSQRGGNIIESVVRMAKWLDLSVIAEGVETVEQADYLKSIGCTYVQGYLYARPMPVADYEALAVNSGKEKRMRALMTVDNLDNNRFWDPSSMDTLIFNSYVGGACIFEYHNGRVEMLRANDKYARMLGSTELGVEAALKLPWAEHLDRAERKTLALSLRQSQESGDDVAGEYLFHDLPGCPPETWLRTTMRVIAAAGDRYLVYCTNENITAEKLAEQQLCETDEQLRFLNEIAHDLLAQGAGERGIGDVLRKLLDYFAGSRAYIFEFDDDRRMTHNTYEVCADGVGSERENLQEIPFEVIGFWLHAFDRQNYISIADVEALDESRPERETLLAQGIHSLIAVPLRRDGRQIGFLGVDDPGHQPSNVGRLDAIGDFIAVMLTRRDLDARIDRDRALVNAARIDAEQRVVAEERLRLSEEETRLALSRMGKMVLLYDIPSRTITLPAPYAQKHGLPEVITDYPNGISASLWLCEADRRAFFAFYQAIQDGEHECAAELRLRCANGNSALESAESVTLFDTAGRPARAIISVMDVTDQREKEAVYNKWQQSLRERPASDYTLFRCNLSKDTSFDAVEGSLLNIRFSPGEVTFNSRTLEYADQRVHPEDRSEYLAVLDSDTLLANYYRGRRTRSLEYRERLEDGSVRWLHLSVELVEYPNSSDIEAFLLYENIDAQKRAELRIKERVETDALTGVLNRATFAARTDALIRAAAPEQRHALLMLDLDGFKLLNDSLGHAAGDQALRDVADTLRTTLRHGDLLGRLGGDEFVIFLPDVPGNAALEKKAAQICALLRRSYGAGIQLTVSLGIAVCPTDGTAFEALYHNADQALYRVKDSGRDGYALFCAQSDASPAAVTAIPEKRRRMLIVDDNQLDFEQLAHIFRHDFIIEKAKDGAAALIRMRHYGTALSVVLLDLFMPGMDGFEVLDQMRNNVELQTIPVIVVSGDESRETSLRAIRSGATDFVIKPVDPDLLCLRVQAAISKAENERLRIQNHYLLRQSEELAKYRAVLASTGTALIEHDWVKATFSYDPDVSRYLAGTYDDRSLWRILMVDMVADAMDVKRMQKLVYDIAGDRSRSGGSMTLWLKTPTGKRRRFRLNILKCADEFELTDKLLLTFNEVEAD